MTLPPMYAEILEGSSFWGPQHLDQAACKVAKMIPYIPGKPVACNYGLLWLISGLLWGIVAYYFGLLGVPGWYHDS